MIRVRPLFATTRSARNLVRPVAYSCVKCILIRDGSVIVSGEFGQRPVSVGDVLLLGADVSCGAEPEGQVTVTTVYLDPGYAVDLFYWQYAGLLLDRLEARDVAETVFCEPIQVLRLGEQCLEELAPVLDELVELSENEHLGESFTRMQALWFLIADAGLTP